ncbi:hypothetical protein FGF1_03850 [Flavobacteriaceae bacterium GF1]
MKTIEYFQSRIDELLEDRQYYEGELKGIGPDPKNPVWAMVQIKNFKKLIRECETGIAHYKKGIIALTRVIEAA